MRKGVAGLVALVVLAVGCDREAAPPRTDLPDSVLVRALAESHIAGVRATSLGEDGDSLRADALAHLGIDSTEVARALDAYAQRPAALAALYDRVTDYLREQQEAHDEARRQLPPPIEPEPDAPAHPDDRRDDR